MMIDFHCHILPKMDDGSDSINTSLAMLREEHTQGVNRVVLTPHFYCEEESIEAFLQRRKKAFSALQTAISDQPHTDDIPELCLGAEVACPVHWHRWTYNRSAFPEQMSCCWSYHIIADFG